MNKQPFKLKTAGDSSFKGTDLRQQVFWASKMHMFLRSKVLSGHKRAESEGTSDTVTRRIGLSPLSLQL